jgi:hypothetical protein
MKNGYTIECKLQCIRKQVDRTILTKNGLISLLLNFIKYSNLERTYLNNFLITQQTLNHQTHLNQASNATNQGRENSLGYVGRIVQTKRTEFKKRKDWTWQKYLSWDSGFSKISYYKIHILIAKITFICLGHHFSISFQNFTFVFFRLPMDENQTWDRTPLALHEYH